MAITPTTTNNNNHDSDGSQTLTPTSNYPLTAHSQILTAVLPAHKLKTPFYSTRINNADIIKAAAERRLQVPDAAAEHQPKALSSLHGKYSVKH